MRLLSEISSAIICVLLVIKAVVLLPFIGRSRTQQRLLLSLESERQRTGGTPIAQFGITTSSGAILPVRYLGDVMVRSKDGKWSPPTESSVGDQKLYIVASGVRVMNPKTGTRGMLVMVQPKWQRK
jgi:hypothetical protein